MSANPWFRMYAEFAHDPKVQMMSEAMQRRFVMVMCMRCSNALVTLHETEIAFHLRISEADLAETKALFVSKGFIDDAWNVLNWDKRQFKSDSSKSRVYAHRERKKQASNGDVTLQKQKCNVLDTDTDTEVNTLSGKPDPKPEKPKPKNDDAVAILDYLNEKTGRGFKPVEANIRLIAARLKETDYDTVKAVVDDRCARWIGDKKMEEYLRPITLFNAQKFASYSGEVSSGSWY